MGEDFNLDPEIFHDFVSATEESLEGLDELFIELENDPGNFAVVQEIFRPVHSIKGNAAFFNLGHMKTLAHDLENLIDKIRKETLLADKEVINTILAGTDMLSQMLARVKNGEPELTDQQSYDDLIKGIEEVGTAFDPLVEYSRFVEKTIAFAQFANEYLVGQDTSEESLSKSMEFESFCQETYKNLLSFTNPNETAQSISENTTLEIDGVPINEELLFLSQILENGWEKEPSEEESEHLKTTLVSMVEKLGDNHKEITEQMLSDYSTFADSPLGLDEALRQSLKGKFDELLPFANEQEGAKGNDSSENNQEENSKTNKAIFGVKKKSHDKAISQKTMRIDQNKIDQFMKFVSELVILSETFKHVRTEISPMLASAELRQRLAATVDQFQSLSTDLQEAILSVRMIAAHQLTQKFPRMVRDLASNLGKEAKVSISGHDIDLDKSLIDALDSPMTHLLRNCLDHGIEEPEKRRDEGKDGVGDIHIDISKKNDFVTIRVSDDGAGINPDALRKKAVDANWMNAEEAKQLTSEQAQALIFRSGFSTAKKVSDVSGRGVGMDVVRSEIEKLGGRIELESAVGKGTKLSLVIPVNITTVVSRVMVAKVGDQIVSVPEEQILEVVSIEKEQYHAHGKSEVVHIRDKVFHVIRIEDFLLINSNKRPLQEGALFLLNKKNKNVALFVDEVQNLQQVIIRKPNGNILDEHFISGIGVHGDGTLSQVLDFTSG